jgi:hypothetical protein
MMTIPNNSPTHRFALSDAPRPTTNAGLNEMLTEFVERVAAQSPIVRGLESVQVESTLDGADVSQLAVDLRGMRIRFGSTAARSAAAKPFGTPISQERAFVRTMSLRAQPLVIQGIDVVVDGRAESLKFSWLIDEKSRLGISLSTEEVGRPLIQLHAEADQDALMDAAMEALQHRLSAMGVSVADLEIDLNPVGKRGATVFVTVKVRKGILSAAVTFEADTSIDDDMVLHINNPQLSSRNALIAALLLATRERINNAVASPIDLNSFLPDWLHLSDIAIALGNRVRVDLTFGG